MKTVNNDAKKRHYADIMHVISLVIGILLVVAYRILSVAGLSSFMYQHFEKPVHEKLSELCDKTDICVGEVLIVIVVFAVLLSIIVELVNITWRKFRSIISIVLIIISTVVFIYGGFCFMWGFYYAAPGVKEICGFSADGVEHEDLIATDLYFLELANEYSGRVNRDQNGRFVLTQESFDHSYELYNEVVKEFPKLEASPRHPKKVFFSKAVSMLDFTGFFFPFTGEACINDDSPDSMKPSTIAHELAHQRGIAAEDEANFIGIIACLEDGSPDYVYSASLLALIHLQNSLYKSGDMDNWQSIRDSYSANVSADFAENSEYWSVYKNKAANKAASGTYDAFLKSYDQEMGRETYGACVDHLVYYICNMKGARTVQ